MIGAMPGEQMAALTPGESMLTYPQSMYSAAPASSMLQSTSKGFSALRMDMELPQQGYSALRISMALPHAEYFPDRLGEQTTESKT